MLQIANKTTNFATDRELWKILADHRNDLTAKIIEESHKPIPNKVKALRGFVNQPIKIAVDGKEVEILPLSFAILMHDPKYTHDLLRCGADIYQIGPDNKCPVDILNEEIDKQKSDKFYDLRLSNIKKSMDSNAFYVATNKYHLYGLIAAPFLSVGLVYIGHFPLFLVYFNAFLLFLRDYAPVIGASWSFFKFGQETINNFDDEAANLANERPQIKSLNNNLIQNNQKQIFNALRYGLYFASYSAIALALISTALYGYLLTAAISTEIIRQSLKLYNLCTLPFTEAHLRTTPNAIGGYYNHRAKIGKTLTKLLSSIAYTAITFAWCFSGGGALTLGYFLSLYVATYSIKGLICHFIDHFMMKQTNQMLDKYFAGDGQAIPEEELADLTLNRIDQLCRALYYYSGLELATTKGHEIKEIISHSIDSYVIKNTRSYLEHLFEMNADLLDHPTFKASKEFLTSFWSQPDTAKTQAPQPNLLSTAGETLTAPVIETSAPQLAKSCAQEARDIADLFDQPSMSFVPPLGIT